jgi:hypothetical protein
MKSPRLGFFLAAGLIPNNAPLAKRLEVLDKYFEPKIGHLSEIDPGTIRDKMVSAKNLGKFGGVIKVKPPKGLCFTITTSPFRTDSKVCHETSLRWSLDDINLESGTINWTIKTSQLDFGTPVSWKVPYVIAKVLPPEAEFFKENSTPIYFKSCQASQGDKNMQPRKITLTKFDNSKWILRLPEKDEHINSLNLSRPGEVWGDAYKAKKDDDQQTPSAPAPESTENTAETTKTEPSEVATTASEPPIDDLEPWTIASGRAFEMSVENFISDVSMPPGRKGSCRYVFDYIPGNLERGRFECHDTGEYRYVYAFLPCLGSLAPKELKEIANKTLKK